MSKHLIRVTASIQVNGAWTPLGAFKTFSGGGYTAGKRKSTPAAGEREVARGGRNTTEDVTIGREDDGTLDLDWLKDQRGCPMTVVRQKLDDTHNPLGKPRVWTGKLNEVNNGDGDAESTDELDEFTLVMLCNG